MVKNLDRWVKNALLFANIGFSEGAYAHRGPRTLEDYKSTIVNIFMNRKCPR